MSTNLRELGESLLGLTVEGPFGLPVDLTAPDGSQFSATGQLVYDRLEVTPDTGEVIVVTNPVAVLRRSSLDTIPANGENWHFRMPLSPSRTATKVDFVLDKSRSIEGGKSLGIIRIYLKFVEQSP